jgi:diguanylate cyclase (GGDEF)-like protein
VRFPTGRLLAVVAPVCGTGILVLLLAGLELATSSPSAVTLLGIAALFVATVVAERYPVPVDGVDVGGVTLSFVFAVAGIVLFGWAAGTLIIFSATTLMQLLEHRPPLRVAYNACVFAIAAAAAGIAAIPFRGEEAGAVVAQIAVVATVDFLVNLLLVATVLSVYLRKPLTRLLQKNLGSMIVPFTLMASAALMLVVLWQRAPLLSAALVGPLLAIALYQRSTNRAIRAMQLALTDPLTGLGNHRHFHERLQRELLDARDNGTPLALCLLDVDDFKGINDRFGHPAGDRVLSKVAARLRQSGEAFRLGGDEFAILLSGCDAQAALTAAGSIVERFERLELEDVGRLTVSAGVAAFPTQCHDRDDLVRLADSALYWAKEHGKNRVRLYRPDVVEIAELKRVAAGPDRAARFRAAASLARAVDARDAYTGRHSERVADLSARIATRIGADDEQVELTRLAASLHDLGKLAIPEEILRKPGPLSDAERLVLERHPQIGYRMLESLGVEPLADLVLHHHERWDGTGYPEGRSGTSIPLGARIIFVADAFDAMTSDRVYRPRRSDGEALEELYRCSGTQFDPTLVDALAAELGVEEPVAAPALALAVGV